MQFPYVESSDATLRWADEKTILSASKKPTCAHRTRPYGASSTGKWGFSRSARIKIWSCENRKAASRNKRHLRQNTYMFLLFPQPPLKKCSKEEVLEYAHAPQNTGVAPNRPGARPKATSRPATGEGQHRMHGRPARGNDCGRARNAIQRGERAPGRPPGGALPPYLFARINVSLKGPGPFLSRPTRWNVFLPMSMPIVAMASRQLVLRGGPASQFKKRSRIPSRPLPAMAEGRKALRYRSGQG